jgi:hypothetical protein
MTRMRTLLAALVVATAAAACTGHGLAATSESLVPRDPGDLLGSSWTLIGVGNTHGVHTHTVLRFVDGIVVSSGACHAQRLAFTDSGGAVRHASGWFGYTPLASAPIGAVAPKSTTVLCTTAPPAIRVGYTRALGVVDTAYLESGSLVLTGPHSVRMVFDPRNATAHHIIDEL